MSEKTVIMKTNKTLMNLSLAVAALLWGVGTSQAQTTIGPTTGSPLGENNYDVPNYANSPLPTLTGALTGVRVLNGGCGWTGTPTLSIDPPTGINGTSIGPAATAHATVVRGVITAVVMDTWGSGYITVPNVTIDPQTALGVPVTCQCPAKLVASMGVVSGTGMRKFVDSLPGVPGLFGGANNLEQSIPLATPDTATYADSDYYVIALVDYRERMHSDLPAQGTRLRGYVQLETTANNTGSDHFALTNLDGTPVLLDGTHQAIGFHKPQYLGPIIAASKNRATRIKFVNLLRPNHTDSDLFIPVDTTLMGSGPGGWARNALGDQEYKAGTYPQSRATLHLHGGLTPWISDGTPHQWTIPVGDTSFYQKGVSTVQVPDMGPGEQGAMTFYWPNQQSGRLMFYHDHAWGTTRLNVYVGEAAGYLLQDTAEDTTLAAAGVPTVQAPLVIQDKTFVWGSKTAAPQTGTYKADPSWATLEPNSVPGDLWWPHVYMANQNPGDLMTGSNPLGRWDYGPWFWPPQVQANINPIPELSTTPESFMDTPVINGTAYPFVEVPPIKVRFRILNACNDRFMNLQLYQADPNGFKQGGFGTEVAMVPAMPNDAIGFPTAWQAQVAGMIPEVLDNRPGGIPDPRLRGPAIIQIGTEGGLLPAPVLLPNSPVGYEQNKRNIVVLNVTQKTLFMAPAERADVVIDFSNFAGKTLILYNDSPAPVPAGDPRLSYYTGNEDFSETAGDNYQGGAPSTLPGYGPNIRTLMQIRVGSTGGSAPVDDYDPTLLSSLNTTLPNMFKLRGERPIVPEPSYPAASGSYSPGTNYSRIQDTSLTWLDASAVSSVTVSGAGPYTYTGGITPPVTISAPDMPGGVQATAEAVLDPTTFNLTGVAVTQAGSGYSVAPGVTIGATPLDSVPLATAALGATVTKPMLAKAIHELFDTYGRMNSILGVEIPFTDFFNQTTIPYQYIDPITESIPQGETQIWKITHNGVDSHVIHFHLVNVQVINRVGWDGAVRPPDANELGWKESVRMNPLEDCIVATRANPPSLPWSLPNSSRVLDPSAPERSTGQFTGVDQWNNPVNTANLVTDFGWEYVWHCHILGHEENDMMRPLVMEMKDLSYVHESIPPTIVGVLSPAPNLAGWYKVAPSLILTGTDNLFGTGIASISSAINGGPTVIDVAPTPNTISWSTTVNPAATAEGVTIVTYNAVDGGGNPSAQGSTTISLDATAPTVSGILSPTPTAAGYINTAGTVTITASDSLSGVASISYRLNDAAAITGPGSTATVNVSAEGVTVVTFTATDLAGNTTVTPGSLTVQKYSVGPVISWGATTPAQANGGGGWFTTDVSMAWTATAQGPLLITTTPAGPLSPNAVSASGSVIITGEGVATTASVAVSDNARNTTTADSSPAVKIDRHAPTIETLSRTAPNGYNWNNGPVAYTFTATDLVAGVTGVSGVDAAASTVSPFSVSTEGANQTAIITLADIAGNSAAYPQTGINIDLTAPIVAVSPAPNAAGWYNNTLLPDNALVSITVSDALSGLLSASRSSVVTGAAPGAYSALTVTGSGQAVYSLAVGGGTGGTRDVYINASDKGLNTLANYLVRLQVDRVAPTVSSVAAPVSLASGWVSAASVNVTITGIDTGGSLLKSIIWSDVNTATAASVTDSSATSPVTVTVSTEGVHTVSYQASDNADQLSTSGSRPVRIDRTPPTVTIGASPASMTAGTGNTTVTFSGILSEAAATTLKSGVATVTYTLTDNSPTPVTSLSGTLNVTQTGVNAGRFSVGLPLPRTSGTVYTFTLGGTDRAGNAVSSTPKTISVP